MQGTCVFYQYYITHILWKNFTADPRKICFKVFNLWFLYQITSYHAGVFTSSLSYAIFSS